MKKYILIILCCLTSFPLWSYNVNMIVEHYSVDQGLPNNTVNCTLKDRDGFIWFGTWYGLCCFDGVKFKTFNKQEHDSDVPPRKIQRIVEDKNGYIWVKTIDRKLYVFNKVTECFHAVYDDMKNYSENIQVIKLQNTAEGDVLLLTKDKNLLLAGVDEKGQVTIKILFDSRDEINKHDYTLKHHVLCETEEYISWIGTDYKVSAVHKGAELASRPADFITSKINSGDKDSFTSFFEDGRKVWVGDRAGIFYSIDVRTGLVNRYVLSEIKGAISNLLVTPAGYVYLSVAGQGTYEYDLAERRLQKINTEMNDAMVTHAFIDQYDKIWFHENEKALIYYDPLNHTAKRFPFTMFGKITTLYSEYAGERGLFFLSPAGEAWLFDREHAEMVYINKLKQLSNDRANQQFYHLMLDNDGVLWLSSADEGVYCMNFPKKQFNLLSLSPQSAGQENYTIGVRALFQSKSGDIWVGTRWQSVYRMDRNGVTKHVFSTGDEHIGNVYHIMEDDKGNLWFSTKGDGLVKAVPDEKAAGGFRFKRYLHNLSDLSSISGNDVYFTYQDEKKRIWVGTLDGGLNLLCEENGEVTFKNKYNGFKNYPTYGLYMEVRNMIEDNDGRMWVGTMDGLMSFKNNFASVEQIDFETYRGANRVNYADSDVYALYKDEFSQIWVCVFGGGLSKLSGYDEETHKLSFKSYGWEDGLNNDVVMSIIEDDNGFLWLATEKGLSCFDRATSQVRNYDKYDGFVICHGTDTMAYTSSALSYLIQNSPKPIIITGAQKPISMEVTDAKTNLLDSLRFAACPDAHGVCIVFNGKVIAGTRAKKVHSKSFNAFDSINFPVLATIRNNQIVHYIKESCPCVCLIKLIPGMDPELLTWVGEHYDAVIIESYGVGGLPSGEHRDFLSEVDKLIADGKIVVMTTQVMYEGSDMEVYEVGHVAKERYGLIESYDMTLEATVTKLMWIMAQTKDPQRIKAMFYTTINHDILFQ